MKVQPKRVNPKKLADACRQLLTKVEVYSHSSPKQDLDGPLRRALHHIQVATKYLSKSESSFRMDVFPSLQDTLEEIITRQLDSMEVEGQGSQGPSPHAVEPVMQGSSGLHGDTRCLGLPELIDCLSVQRKDGVLNAMFDAEIITVWFSQGDLVHAVSNRNPTGMLLGDILVSEGMIEKTVLEDFLERHADTGKRLGELVIQEQIVTMDQLRVALGIQIQHIFSRLYKNDHAHYSFHEGLPKDAESQIRFNVTQLLLESARQLDERAEQLGEASSSPAPTVSE